MQVTLKQSEITAAIAAYLTNVLGVSNVSPETLSVVYKQGRSDKNGMTAELDIEAPAYHKPADVQKAAEVLPSKVADGQLSASLTHEVAARSNDHAVAASTDGAEPKAEQTFALGNASASTQTEATSASAAQAPEVAPAEAAQDPEPIELPDPTPVYEGERRAEPREEVPAEPEAQVEPAAEVEAPVEEPAKAAEPVAAASPLFG